jgi:PIN domain nuclease of toxin-antitoxin system
MRLLLDTHLLLWAAGSPKRLPPAARELLNDVHNDPVSVRRACGRLRSSVGLGDQIFE